MTADVPTKAALLHLPRVPHIPRCDECGAERTDVKSEWYVLKERKRGYSVKTRKFAKLCGLCKQKHDDGPFHHLLVGMDLAAGPDLTAGYVYAPYIPQGLFGPGGRLMR